jgi:hypothetical protein
VSDGAVQPNFGGAFEVRAKQTNSGGGLPPGRRGGVAAFAVADRAEWPPSRSATRQSNWGVDAAPPLPTQNVRGQERLGFASTRHVSSKLIHGECCFIL